MPGFGLRLGFSNIGFQQEPLPAEMSLLQYAHAQIQTMSSIAAGVQPNGPHVSSWQGAEEALDRGWRLTETENQFVIVQIIARAVGQVGIATFMTTAADLATTATEFRAVREKLEFKPDAPCHTREYAAMGQATQEQQSAEASPDNMTADSDALNPS